LQQRAGDEGGFGPDLQRPLQPEGAGHLRAAQADAADGGRLLHAPGRPDGVRQDARAGGQAVRRQGGVGEEGDPERGQLGAVLQRPDHPPVRRRDLGGEAGAGGVSLGYAVSSSSTTSKKRTLSIASQTCFRWYSVIVA